MAKHRHVVGFYVDESSRCWFACELCPGRVELVPVVHGDRVTTVLEVESPGIGGFSADELQGMAAWWMRQFVSFAESDRRRRLGRGGRRRRSRRGG